MQCLTAVFALSLAVFQKEARAKPRKISKQAQTPTPSPGKRPGGSYSNNTRF